MTAPVRSPIIVPAQNKQLPRYLADGLLRTLLACLYSQTDCQHSVFPAHPPPDHSSGNLCKYAKGGLRFSKWMSGVLPGYMISYYISLNPNASRDPCQLDPVIFCQFHNELIADPGSFKVCLQTIKHLNGFLTVRKNQDHGSWTHGPSGCIMQPTVTSVNCVHTIKIT